MSEADSETPPTTTRTGPPSHGSTSSTSSQQSLRTPDPPTAPQSHLFYQSAAPYGAFSYVPPFGGSAGGTNNSAATETWPASSGTLDTTSYLQTLNPAVSSNQTPLMTNQVLAGGLNPASYMSTAPLMYPAPAGAADYPSFSTATPQDVTNFPYSQFGLFNTAAVIPGSVAMPTTVVMPKARENDVEAAGEDVKPASGNEQSGSSQTGSGVETSFSKMSVSASTTATGNDAASSKGGGAQESTPSSLSTTSSSSPASTSKGSGNNGGPKSWAAIASQPAKLGIVRPKPPPPQQQSQVGFGPPSSSSSSGGPSKGEGLGNKPTSGSTTGKGRGWSNQRRAPPTTSSTPASTSSSLGNGPVSSSSGPISPSSGLSSISVSSSGAASGGPTSVSVLERLRAANQYNPKEFTIDLKGARFFVIKSYSEDDIHRSIKYSIWTSTPSGNSRLDRAFGDQKGLPVYLLYSVNGSGHFCGVAEMTSHVDYDTHTGVFTQDKWKGRFDVKWIYVKDVPNNQLRHIRLENNENKPVTNSRDTQEVASDKGKQILRIVHNYKATTSIFDDFGHYEKRQEEDHAKKATTMGSAQRGPGAAARR